MDQSGQFDLIGLTSFIMNPDEVNKKVTEGRFGNFCNHQKTRNYFESVSFYLGWIKKKIRTKKVANDVKDFEEVYSEVKKIIQGRSKNK